MASSCSNNNTPIALNLQEKSYKIPVSTNVPIELTTGDRQYYKIHQQKKK